VHCGNGSSKDKVKLTDIVAHERTTHRTVLTPPASWQ
jgi:hypothetical protein